MPDDRIDINVNLKEKQFIDQYNKLASGVYNIIDTYTKKIQRTAKDVIKQDSYINTGRLRNSIKQYAKNYGHKVEGEVYSGTKYARFIHEGAEHQSDTEIKPFFVPFSVAPTLLKWAVKHKVIQWRNGQYYYIDKDNKEHSINVKKGGMKVYIKPSKFFSKALQLHYSGFMRAIDKAVDTL